MCHENSQVFGISIYNEGLRCVMCVNGDRVTECSLEHTELVRQIHETAAGLSAVLGVSLKVCEQSDLDQDADLFDGDPVAACAHQERMAL